MILKNVKQIYFHLYHFLWVNLFENKKLLSYKYLNNKESLLNSDELQIILA
jgi:hypothetical protein